MPATSIFQEAASIASRPCRPARWCFPGRRPARGSAQVMARLSLLNAYTFLFGYATDPEHVYGVHRPSAFVFWTSLLHPGPGLPPANPLIGIRVYIPGMKLKLPLLPDIALDDLRTLDLPLPILEVSRFNQERLPAWLPLDGRLSLEDWRGLGPIPPTVRERFPNR